MDYIDTAKAKYPELYHSLIVQLANCGLSVYDQYHDKTGSAILFSRKKLFKRSYLGWRSDNSWRPLKYCNKKLYDEASPVIYHFEHAFRYYYQKKNHTKIEPTDFSNVLSDKNKKRVLNLEKGMSK